MLLTPLFVRLGKYRGSEGLGGGAVLVAVKDLAGLGLHIGGVFQGSCRVNRLTMPLVSRSVALDPGSAARCRSAPSYASGLTTAPVCFPWLVRTAHVAGPRPDDPAPDAALSRSEEHT